jgi:hypothetical protein
MKIRSAWQIRNFLIIKIPQKLQSIVSVQNVVNTTLSIFTGLEEVRPENFARLAKQAFKSVLKYKLMKGESDEQSRSYQRSRQSRQH